MEFNKTDFNKQCADFMGYQYFGWNHPNHQKEVSSRGYWAKKGAKIHNAKLNVRVNPLRYDFDWNWIMEVVEKIESLGYWVCIQNTYIGFGKKNDESSFLSYSFSNMRTTKKEAVIQAIWEFLNWYNNQTTEKS